MMWTLVLAVSIAILMCVLPAAAAQQGQTTTTGGERLSDNPCDICQTPVELLTMAMIEQKVGHYIFLGRYQEAYDFIQKNSAGHLTDPRYYYLNGKALFYLGRFAEALEYLSWGEMLDPTDKDLVFKALVEAALR